MDLVPVREQTTEPATTPAPPGQQGQSVPSAASPPVAAGASSGLFSISPERQQLIGVRFAEAARRALSKTIRTVGRVELDERRIAQVHTKISGWIEETFVDFTWKHVSKGDPLFTIYSPELVSTQEEYLLALRAEERLGGESNPFPQAAASARSLVGAARARLQLWDVTPEQIEELERTRAVKRTLTIFSPVSGHVVERNAFPRMRVTPETTLYTIADHSNVWVQVDIYENEIGLVRLGQRGPMTVQAYPGESFGGVITYIQPHLEMETRTLKVRLEFPNADLRLKPGMYAEVKLEIPLGTRLVVPKNAVLRAGEQDIVFVDRGGGQMEVRRVRLGLEVEDSYEVLSGLRAGERIVAAANFLVDAESQVQGAVATWEDREGSTAPGPARQPTEEARPGLAVEILEPKQARVGRNIFHLRIKDAAGLPVENAEVEVTLLMPAMGTMAPISATARLQPSGQGEYTGTIEIPTSFSWQTTVTVKKGGQIVGSVRTTIIAQ